MFTIAILAVATGLGGDNAPPHQGITRREAQTLSVGELAHRVLGQAGDTVIDVERPKDDRCGTACPWSPTLDPDTKMQGITFYARAQPYNYGNLMGFCRATDDVVIFDKSGFVKDLSQRFKIGLVGQLVSMQTGYSPPEIAERSKQMNAEQRRCENIETTKNFVVVPNYEDGALAFIAIATIHNMIAQKSNMAASCAIISGGPNDCKSLKDFSRYIDDIKPEKVTSVSTLYNRAQIAEIRGYPNAKCYSVGLTRSQVESENVNVCLDPSGSNGVKILKVKYSLGMIVF